MYDYIAILRNHIIFLKEYILFFAWNLGQLFERCLIVHKRKYSLVAWNLMQVVREMQLEVL